MRAFVQKTKFRRIRNDQARRAVLGLKTNTRAELLNSKQVVRMLVLAIGLLFLIAFSAAPAFARNGGDISGGGTGCLKPNYPNPYFLLDFAPFERRLHTLREPGEQVGGSKTLQRLGFNTFEFKKTKAFALLMARLQLWKSEDTGRLTERIMSAEELLNVLVTTNELSVGTPLFEDQQKLCQENEVSTVALYYRENVAISIPHWNQLDLPSQGGIILHETLRRLQIGQNQNYTLETEKQLRNFVAHVMLFTPKEDPNFNFAKESDGIVYSRLDDLREKSEALRAPVCKLLNEWVEQDSILGAKLMKRMQDQDCFLHPEFLPKDIHESEDGRMVNCLVANRLLPGMADSTVTKYRGDLAFASAMIQAVEATPEFAKKAAKTYCGEPISRDWSVHNQNMFNNLDAFVAFTVTALQTRAIRVSDLGTPETRETYRKRTLFLAQVLNYFNFTLREQYGKSDRNAAMGTLFKAADYKKSSAYVVRIMSAYIESDSSSMSDEERAKMDAGILQLKSSLEGLIKDGLLM